MPPKYPYWSDAELERIRRRAREIYVEHYKTETRRGFAEIEQECVDEVVDLLRQTDCLRSFGKDPGFFDKHPELLRPARFITSPAISNDTLKIVGQEEGHVATILSFVDRERFPWLGARRKAKVGDPEVDAAVRLTAKLMAEQRRATSARTTSSQAQEEKVRAALEKARLKYVEPEIIRERLRKLGDDPKEGLTRTNYQEALRRAEFTREIAVAGTKCDVPTRLKSGDLLPIECKVSNTEVNSVKRLNRETGGKHQRWRNAFGADVHTGAVLSGVFKLRNLKDAQRDGILIFFEHDLGALHALIKAGGQPRPKP
jgi:XamI restriction endonuclease